MDKKTKKKILLGGLGVIGIGTIVALLLNKSGTSMSFKPLHKILNRGFKLPKKIITTYSYPVSPKHIVVF